MSATAVRVNSTEVSQKTFNGQLGEIAQFLLRQVDLPEQRIGEDLVQFGEEAVLVGGGEIAQIEVVGLRQPQQDLRRHRALVPLYQVDIARRNAQPLGDRLGHRDHAIGGLTFPGRQSPDYWDFLYFSLVIAMTSQVSDVVITSKVIRRIVTVHGALAFFFNVSVIALTVNIISNLI